MRPSKIFGPWIICLAALVFSSLSTPGWAFSVQPTVVDLQPSGRRMSTVVTVENNLSIPLPLELSIQELELTATGLTKTGKDPGDLLVFPPTAVIQPGRIQTLRVQWVGDPELKRSRHFVITIAQLPVKLPDTATMLQVLYNFEVYVSVAPMGVTPDVQVRQAAIEQGPEGKPRPVLTVENVSPAHGYLSQNRLRIVQKDSAGKELFRRAYTSEEVFTMIGFGLLASGQKRNIPLPIDLPSGEGQIEAQFTSSRRR
jgi:P pilus assembly chaperone PapD